MKNFFFTFLFFGFLTGSLTAQNRAVWTVTGIGGGGSLFSPSINPADCDEFYTACDMGELFHTVTFGNQYEIVDSRRFIASNNSVVRFTNSEVRYSINYADDLAVPVKSYDSGMTWSTLPGNPDEYEETYSIWVDYNHPDRVLISYYDLLYYSDNGGDSFRLIHEAQNSGAGIVVGGVFFDEENIYVGTNDGVLVSGDGGNSFYILSDSGMGAGECIFSFAAGKQDGITRFVVLTADKDDIYVGITGTDYWGFMKGVYFMDNLSGTWTKEMSGIDTDSDFLMFVGMAENDIYNIYLGGSSDIGVPNVMKAEVIGGEWNWQHVFNTQNNQNIRTGWCGDGGDRDWSYPECLFGLAVAPQCSNVVIITDMGFVTKTDDGGNMWSQAYVSQQDQNQEGVSTPAKKYYHSTGLENTSAWFLHWFDSDKIFAAYTDIFGICSEDGGKSWAFDYNAPWINTMYHIVQSGRDNTLYAATSSLHDLYKSYILEDDLIDAATGNIMYSTDMGKNWSVLHDFGNPVYWLAADPNNENRLYAAVVNHSDGEGGIYVTDNLDDGTASQWTQLPPPPRTEGHPATITVLNNGDLVCSFSGRRDEEGNFTNSSGIFVYHPSTQTWDDRSCAGQHYWCRDLVVDPYTDAQNCWYSCVYSGWGGNGNDMGGLYRTLDAGNTWEKILDGVDVSSCTVNPENHDELFVTTHGDGLWYCTNVNVNNPEFVRLDNYHFAFPERVFFNPFNTEEIWVTSFGNGLQHADNTLFSGEKKDNGGISVYPNPASDYLKITIENRVPDNYSLKIFDVSGKLILEKSMSHTNSITVDCNRFNAGIYMINVFSGDKIYGTKKVVIK